MSLLLLNSLSRGSFSPVDLASLEAWYDISDAGTITESGGSVSQIDDKSSNSNHATQSTGSLQPTFGSDANGNFLQFTGSGLFASQNYLELTSTVSGKTVFFVCDHDGSTFSGVLGNDQASSSHIFLQQNSYAISLDGAASDVGSWYLDGAFQATGGNVGSPTAIGNNIRVHTVKYNVGDPATGFNLISAFTNTKIGGFGGKIREIIIYDEYLSDADRENVENYLLSKWDI